MLKVLASLNVWPCKLNVVILHGRVKLTNDWKIAYGVFDEIFVDRNAFHDLNHTLEVELRCEDLLRGQIRVLTVYLLYLIIRHVITHKVHHKV